MLHLLFGNTIYYITQAIQNAISFYSMTVGNAMQRGEKYDIIVTIRLLFTTCGPLIATIRVIFSSLLNHILTECIFAVPTIRKQIFCRE